MRASFSTGGAAHRRPTDADRRRSTASARGWFIDPSGRVTRPSEAGNVDSIGRKGARMRTVAALCSLLSTLPWASIARAGDAPCAWRSARWGMTVDEVLAALPGEAVRASPDEVAKGAAPVRMEGCEIAGTKFQAQFFFYRNSRLTKIVFAPSSKRDAGRPLFDRIARMLAERHGPPKTDIDQDLGLAGLRTAQRSWLAGGEEISVTYMYGTGDPYFSLVYDAPKPDQK